VNDQPRLQAGREKLARRAIDEAERRVRRDMAEAAVPAPRTLVQRQLVVAAALALFAGGFALRLAVDDPGALIANFYAIPIAMLAATFGIRGGLAAAALAFTLVFAWGAVTDTHVSVLGYSTRGAVFLVVGAAVGWYAERLPRAAARGRGAEYELGVRNEELERTNAYLAQAVLRLEAFAEIARAVGGETDLQRVLQLILDHGREVTDARAAVVYLREGDELGAVAATEAGHTGARLPVEGSLPGFILVTGHAQRVEQPALGLGDSAAVLAPLAFRGETFGVVALIDRLSPAGPAFDEEDEELLESVAASAATAVITAQSVARERLRDSIAASEEARGRWARELHDDTLQGLAGLRVLLSSALRTGSPERLRDAVGEAVDLTKGEIDSLRGLIAELRPAALDELGLEPALAHLAERSAATGIEVSTRFALTADPGRSRSRLAPETESTIYRVVQEALTNVAKHARAEHVEVAVERSNGSVRVQVTDDGCGFDPSAPDCAGLGLVGMRERVELAGGALAIESRPAGPTVVRALVPAS
jgi:signal transduction histidine kinase